MYINEVIPLTSLPRSQPQTLSYFSSEKLPWGALVSIPLAKKSASGIIINSYLIESKISIKKAGFKLKPITKILSSDRVLTDKQLELIKWLAEYYFLPLSGLLRIALPNQRVLNKMNLAEFSYSFSQRVEKDNYLFSDDFIFLRQKIKESIGNNRQVLIIAPNHIKLEIYKHQLAEFGEEVVVFDKTLPLNKILELYKEISANGKKLIFGLRSVIFAPFANLGLIVVVEEENPSQESWETKIHFNSKKAAWKLKEIFNSQLIFISQNPSVENWPLIQKKILSPVGQLAEIPIHKIEITEWKGRDDNNFLAPKILEKIKDGVDKGGKILIFVNRRGLAPALICQDCGSIIKCPHCEVALVHHYIPPNFELHCHHCGFKTEPTDLCPNCQSHLIKFLGLATQKVVNFLQKRFPRSSIRKFDSDHLKSLKIEERFFTDFKKNKIQILVATELFFKFLDELTDKIDLSVMISAEQSLIFPDFRGEERLKRVIQKLTAASHQVTIQTLDFQRPFFQNLSNLEKFYEKELELRSRFFYPPYSEIIKITISHRQLASLNRLAQYFYQCLNQRTNKLLTTRDYIILPPKLAFIPKINNYYLKEIFLKIRRDPEDQISLDLIKKRNQILRILPDDVSIKIDPINLL